MRIEKSFYTEEAAFWRSMESEEEGDASGVSGREDLQRLEREAQQIEEKAENEKKTELSGDSTGKAGSFSGFDENGACIC